MADQQLRLDQSSPHARFLYSLVPGPIQLARYEQSPPAQRPNKKWWLLLLLLLFVCLFVVCLFVTTIVTCPVVVLDLRQI